MTEIFSSLIIPLVSIIGSFLTVLFTVRCNFKNHINESAFEKRKELYEKFLNLLINIKSNPYLQFEKETLDYLEKIKAEFMLRLFYLLLRIITSPSDSTEQFSP